MHYMIIPITPIDRTMYFKQIKYWDFRSMLKMYTCLHYRFHKIGFVIDWINTSSKTIIQLYTQSTCSIFNH